MKLQINKIYNMDCREGMKLIDDNSIASIVTDPPYELGFMGKKWDKSGIAYNVDMWRECLRVLKPGGYLLAFGGTRTYHRMACAIEDAGFEIRDQMQWIYGSGFPKSMDISKAIDKAAGVERQVLGIKIYGDGKQCHSVSEKAMNESAGKSQSGRTTHNPLTAPATPEAKQWEGWGTALKPANEPICVARKPLDGTVAENVLKWGTGGINIDACRVDGEERQNPQAGYIRRGRTDEEIFMGTDKNKPEGTVTVTGRFPANVIFDEQSAELLDRQSSALKSGNNCVRTKEGHFLERGGIGKAGDIQTTYGDSGFASRFFYVAKASRAERDFWCEELPESNRHTTYGDYHGTAEHSPNINSKSKNFHPTVKPIKLIEYLVTLVTPKGGTCLDPFEGSGTHQRACITLGFDYIGFEIEKAYFEIAQKRADNVQIQML